MAKKKQAAPVPDPAVETITLPSSSRIVSLSASKSSVFIPDTDVVSGRPRNVVIRVYEDEPPSASFDRKSGVVDLGGEKVLLTERESCVIQALIEGGPMSLRTLKDKSGYKTPNRIIEQLLFRCPGLRPYLTMAGKKGNGYSTTIRPR
jgi:hypothetical protein